MKRPSTLIPHPRISRELVFFLGSSVAFQASRLGVNLVAAAILAPAVFGAWSIVFTVLAYTVHGNLGILSGANRLIPIRLGQRRDDAAVDLERVALGGTLAAALVLMVAVFAVALAVDEATRSIWVVCALAVAAQQMYLFAQVSLRARLDFNAASLQQLALAVLFPVLGLPLVAASGVAGLTIAQAASYAAGAGLLWAVWRRGLRPRLDGPATLGLLRAGFPIMLSGLAFTAMTSVDRWVVLWLGGQALLGQYALASIVSSSLMFVSLVVAQQFYPQLAHAYGAGVEHAGLIRLALRQSATSVTLNLPIAAAIILGGPLVVPALVPKYADSVPALQLLALGYMVLAGSTGSANLLVTIGRAWVNVVIQLLAAVGGSVLAAIALDRGMGLTGVATATLTSLVGYAVAVAVVASRVRDR